MFTNFDASIPLVLGTEPDPDLNQQQIVDSSIVYCSSNCQQTLLTDNDPPHTYDSAVQHTK